MTKRPVSVSHLVFGLIFLGIAALWVIGVTTDAEAPDFALWVPAILIGAGVIGLIATLANARRRDYPPSLAADEPVQAEQPEPTYQTDQTDPEISHEEHR